MGLDAFVPCRCWELGRCQGPPFPPDYLEMQEGKWELKAEYDNDRHWVQLLAWQKKACAHPEFEVAHEHLSNWSGYRAFQESIDPQKFPILGKQLPHSNGGSLGVDHLAACLEELDRYLAQDQLGWIDELLDGADDAVLFEHIAAYDGVFYRDGSTGYMVGVDPQGFFLQEMDGPILFRSRRATWKDGTFTDLESGQSWSGPIILPRGAQPVANFYVRRRVRRVEDFQFITQPLRRLLKAAIQTGSPIYWC